MQKNFRKLTRLEVDEVLKGKVFKFTDFQTFTRFSSSLCGMADENLICIPLSLDDEYATKIM